MYLKRLEIQGYKSFANRTEFTLNSGITAIVGPNGSGKSNIADAVRWVLGEQSYSALRAKRTEDLIFSGSGQRARLGLAEVSLVLDNSAHWLPLDYNELTITRRANRSGENEYHLNGNRVRLRDIVELLTRAGLGRNASAVIGQGQVDAALSLRPEERRPLFEEAAGIRIYIDKRDQALARLEEARHNLERLNDILNEITPRLETLRRQAERTQDYETVRADLEATLLIWYGYQWQRHQDRLARSEQSLAEQSERVRQQRALVEDTAAQREALRNRQQAIRDDIRQRRQEGEQQRSRYEELRRRLAVLHERSRALQREQDQVQADLSTVEARRLDLRAAVDRQEQELATLLAALAKQQAAESAAKAQLSAAEAALRAQRDELERARGVVFEIATAQAAARNRHGQLLRRCADLEKELAEQQGALLEAESRVVAAAADLQAAEDERQQGLISQAETERELRQAEDELAASLTRLDALRRERDAAREAHQRLATQNDVLRRARGQASHLYEGAQTVIRERMPGVLGIVASLIEAPAELEVAIEAALGGHLQDIVVKSWNDALSCIELLKRGDRGRATFLPLDYVQPRQPMPVPRVPGVRGIAARLVKVEPVHRVVCELLLGSIVIVDDLPAGRRALTAEPRLRRAVTLDGDVVEARGVVRGGSRPRGRGFLAQEREWRELPEQLTAAQQALERAEAEVHAEDERQQAHRGRARQNAQRLQLCRQTLNEREQRTFTLRQRHDRLLQETTWHRSLVEQASRSLAEVQVDLPQLEGELAAVENSLAEATQRVEALRRSVENEDLQHLRRQTAESETALAVSLRARQAQEDFITSQREALARTDAEAESRQARLERLQQEAAGQQQELDSLRRSLEAVKQAQEAMSQPLALAEAELQNAEKQQENLEAEEGLARQELQAQLADLNHLTYERERAQEGLEEIKRQMEAELGPTEVPDLGQPRQLRLSLGSSATPLPKITQLPGGLTSHLKEVRARLRRLGPVNPNAPSEYEEVLQRHKFLTDQMQDLSKAADSTREIIAELNHLIRNRFAETFARVAREFSACFNTLFGGGSARLLLTEPDNLTESGVEIAARPPGKRSQSLALLSGGERVLTAVALLFALLKVNPLPFCVLDEVDAMLDEVNVNRFRAYLESLAQTTQFIVITHNRITIEAASTIYGVSMAREGVSQILSMALPDKQGQEIPEATPAA